MDLLNKGVRQTLEELSEGMKDYLNGKGDQSYKILHRQFRTLVIRERWVAQDDCIELLDRVLTES